MKCNVQSEEKNSNTACKHELQFTFKAGKHRKKELNFWGYFSTNKPKVSDFS